MDKITFSEITALMENQYLKDKEAWEQMRLLGFIIAKSNGAKINKVESLIEFPWEKEAKKKAEPVFMTDEQMAQFRKKAQSLIDNNFFD